ncbi:MAG TPA: ATP-binding protein [Terriglobales bacterium]|nr:ATP-binding protein [Terriglobales bacterium]
MRSRSSLVLAFGFGILVVLIAVLGFGAIRQARVIYSEMEATQQTYLETEAFRRDIATDMYLADILVRDYLLDPSPHNAPRHRQELLEIRSSLQSRVDTLSDTKMGGSDSPGLARLNEEVQGYWESLDPIFDWTPQQKAELSWSFLRHKVLPRRKAVVKLAREVAKLNRDNLEKERERISRSQQVFRTFLIRMMWFALPLGTGVALVTIYRVGVLERRHDEQTRRIEETENNLRRLSRKLVQAHETERKSLSRELHDEVGQTLTALGIELGNLQSLKSSDPDQFRGRIEELKRLNTEAMRFIRDLAMGLRPSMLDDLGLGPALEWQGREFSRHTGVATTVNVEAATDDLPEAHRTCIYRVVQEALTNCAKHANANHVSVSVTGNHDSVNVVVQDDGVGFVPSSRRSGLGLLGIEERVQELEGQVKIESAQGRGTTVRVQIPVHTGAAEWARQEF